MNYVMIAQLVELGQLEIEYRANIARVTDTISSADHDALNNAQQLATSEAIAVADDFIGAIDENNSVILYAVDNALRAMTLGA